MLVDYEFDCLGERRMTDTPLVPGRVYQASRDSERMQIEERAKALSEAGYPLPEDDPAMQLSND